MSTLNGRDLIAFFPRASCPICECILYRTTQWIFSPVPIWDLTRLPDFCNWIQCIFEVSILTFFTVQFFQEGHKNLKKSSNWFDVYLVNFKSPVLYRLLLWPSEKSWTLIFDSRNKVLAQLPYLLSLNTVMTPLISSKKRQYSKVHVFREGQQNLELSST